MRLARIEAHIVGCILRGTSCEYWSEKHETKLTCATNRINEATRERDELTKKVKELSDLVLELTTHLNQGESQIQSVERVCTICASDFHTRPAVSNPGKRGQPVHIDYQPCEHSPP